MAWRHIMFVVDPVGHVGPRLLRKLTHLARALEADVELFESAFEWGVLNQGGIGSGASDHETHETIQRRDRELNHVVEALQASGIHARGTVNSERPGHIGICRHVVASKPDLLVIQTTRHSSLARLLLSYTDFKLIETCPCPVLMLKTEKSYLEACVVAAVDPMHSHAKPAALDEAIIDAASQLATAVGGTLHICHAHTPQGREECESRVHALARRAKLADDHTHLAGGDPSDVVPRFARSLQADVMVMGAVSRSALERVLIGYTAERVLDALNCDVLVVKPLVRSAR